MSDSEKIKELEAIIVVLAKKIEEIRRKTIGGATMQSDENWLKDLKKEASKLNLQLNINYTPIFSIGIVVYFFIYRNP